MKNILSIVLLLVFVAAGYSQEKKEFTLNEETNLIEATYYHENGQISQIGTFNLEHKLHGEWVSYNEEGKKVAVGSYKNGIKTGKWSFWSNDVLKEVEYSNNAIASVNGIKTKPSLVSH